MVATTKIDEVDAVKAALNVEWPQAVCALPQDVAERRHLHA